MKTIVLVLLAMVMMAGTAMAEGNFNPPQKCPDIKVTCNCAETVLPGLWAVNIGGVGRCGELSIISTVFVIYANDGSVKFYPVTQLNKAKQVEACE